MLDQTSTCATDLSLENFDELNENTKKSETFTKRESNNENVIIKSEIFRAIQIQLSSFEDATFEETYRRRLASNSNYVCSLIDEDSILINPVKDLFKGRVIRDYDSKVIDMNLFEAMDYNALSIIYSDGTVFGYELSQGETDNEILVRPLFICNIEGEIQKPQALWKDSTKLGVGLKNELVLIESSANDKRNTSDEDADKSLQPRSFNRMRFAKNIKSFAFSPKYALVYLLFEDNMISVLNTENGYKIREFKPYNNLDDALSILSYKNLAKQWPLKVPGQKIEISKTHDYSLKDIFLTISQSLEVKVWDLSEWDNSTQTYYCIETRSLTKDREEENKYHSKNIFFFNSKRDILFIASETSTTATKILSLNINPWYQSCQEDYHLVKKSTKFFTSVSELILPNKMVDIVSLDVENCVREALSSEQNEATNQNLDTNQDQNTLRANLKILPDVDVIGFLMQTDANVSATYIAQKHKTQPSSIQVSQQEAESMEPNITNPDSSRPTESMTNDDSDIKVVDNVYNCTFDKLFSIRSTEKQSHQETEKSLKHEISHKEDKKVLCKNEKELSEQSDQFSSVVPKTITDKNIKSVDTITISSPKKLEVYNPENFEDFDPHEENSFPTKANTKLMSNEAFEIIDRKRPSEMPSAPHFQAFETNADNSKKIQGLFSDSAISRDINVEEIINNAFSKMLSGTLNKLERKIDKLENLVVNKLNDKLAKPKDDHFEQKFLKQVDSRISMGINTAVERILTTKLDTYLATSEKRLLTSIEDSRRDQLKQMKTQRDDDKKANENLSKTLHTFTQTIEILTQTLTATQNNSKRLENDLKSLTSKSDEIMDKFSQLADAEKENQTKIESIEKNIAEIANQYTEIKETVRANNADNISSKARLLSPKVDAPRRTSKIADELNVSEDYRRVMNDIYNSMSPNNQHNQPMEQIMTYINTPDKISSPLFNQRSYNKSPLGPGAHPNNLEAKSREILHKAAGFSNGDSHVPFAKNDFSVLNPGNTTPKLDSVETHYQLTANGGNSHLASSENQDLFKLDPKELANYLEAVSKLARSNLELVAKSSNFDHQIDDFNKRFREMEAQNVIPGQDQVAETDAQSREDWAKKLFKDLEGIPINNIEQFEYPVGSKYLEQIDAVGSQSDNKDQEFSGPPGLNFTGNSIQGNLLPKDLFDDDDDVTEVYKALQNTKRQNHKRAATFFK